MITADFSWGCRKEMALQLFRAAHFCLATVSVPVMLSCFPAPLANSSGVFASHVKRWGTEVPIRSKNRLVPQQGRRPEGWDMEGHHRGARLQPGRRAGARLAFKPVRPSQLARTCPPHPQYTHFWERTKLVGVQGWKRGFGARETAYCMSSAVET